MSEITCFLWVVLGGGGEGLSGKPSFLIIKWLVLQAHLPESPGPLRLHMMAGAHLCCVVSISTYCRHPPPPLGYGLPHGGSSLVCAPLEGVSLCRKCGGKHRAPQSPRTVPDPRGPGKCTTCQPNGSPRI